jgi:hypothetical protein
MKASTTLPPAISKPRQLRDIPAGLLHMTMKVLSVIRQTSLYNLQFPREIIQASASCILQVESGNLQDPDNRLALSLMSNSLLHSILGDSVNAARDLL